MKKPLIIIAGPCVVESRNMLFETAEVLTSIFQDKNVDFFFKASYKKANRTSHNSFTGIGDEKALRYLNEVGSKFNVKTLTDVHNEDEVKLASAYVDVLQIPAFLCRQTALIQTAARSGKIVNIKKGQFVGVGTMIKAAEKAWIAGAKKIWITERGSFFGYHDLVVDFRSIVSMQKEGFITVYDATHSVQQPSIGEQSGGKPEFIFPLAKAAIAAGVNGVFFETHPNPDKALSDAASQLPLSVARDFVNTITDLYEKL
jgi:2-dehydro-3-deoxyphosphooctonate aldolase (KDO 8-P synthase)